MNSGFFYLILQTSAGNLSPLVRWLNIVSGDVFLGKRHYMPDFELIKPEEVQHNDTK
jgi:hypothetical protein